MQLKMSGVRRVLAKIPLGEKSLQIIWILVLSQHLPHFDSSKAPNTSLLDRRYLSTHHQFHNPLTWSERQLLTPAAHLRVSDSADSGGDNTAKHAALGVIIIPLTSF